MGCDIHVFIEYSRDNGKTWQADKNHVQDPDNQVNRVTVAHRYYALFGLLAGVRGCDQMYDRRGIPYDVSEMIKRAIEFYGPDGHSYTWLTLDEFTDAVKRCWNDQHQTNPNTCNFKMAMKLAKPIAFYDWQIVFGGPDRDTYISLSYPNLLAYCNQQLCDIEAEHILLGDPTKPKCRLVFFFDN